jgi:uncharacterized protein
MREWCVEGKRRSGGGTAEPILVVWHLLPDGRMNRLPKLLLGAAAGAGALATYALAVEPRWIQVTRPRIHVAGLPQGLEGLRIALLTDLHVGNATSLGTIRRACRAAMRERPDLIAVTGDFSDNPEQFDRTLDVLSTMEAPLGIYAVPGNHDHLAGIDRWHNALRGHANIQDLTNRAVVRKVRGANLCIAGVDDYSFGQPSLAMLPPSEEREFTLLLAHDPDQAEFARRDDDQVDLILSGHTHGGQVRLPFLGAVINPATRDDLYEQGLRRRPWTQVYTSRGVGTVHYRIRFLCRPEVAVLQLTRAPRPKGRR